MLKHARIVLLMISAFLLTTIPSQTQNPVTTPGGSTNKLPKFTSSTAVSDSSIYDNGNVGIGTTSPAFNLDVVGGIQSQATDFPQINLKQTGALPQEYRQQINSDDGSFRVYDITAGIRPRFVLTQAGNVGIGTTAPSFNLDVLGSIQTQASAFPQLNFKQTGSVSQEYRHQINADGSYRIYDMTAGAVPRFTITQSGYVGIGTTSAGYTLDVNGYMRTTSGIVFPNGTVQTTASTGGGTITGVIAGTGLTGGGYSGNVTLSIDGTVARNNSNNNFSSSQDVSGTLAVHPAGFNVYGTQSTINSGIALGLWNKSNSVQPNTGDIIMAWGQSNQLRAFRVDTYGSVFANNSFFPGGADYAESVNVSGLPADYEPGDVLVIGTPPPTSLTGGVLSTQFRKSQQPNSQLVAGVYSTKPGILSSNHPMDLAQFDAEVPLAVLGIVPCKVSTENGPISPGDLLVTSATPGYAMKANDTTKSGTILGKALQPLATGTGKIRILLTLQ